MNMPNLVKELEVEVEFLAERIAPPPPPPLAPSSQKYPARHG